MPETMLRIKCPFCKENLKMETYRMRKGYAPTSTIYCDNDTCSTKPSTIDMCPSKAFADVAAWGSVEGDSES
ncbi:hypothetical protein D3C75_1157220 [compost metagenome]